MRRRAPLFLPAPAALPAFLAALAAVAGLPPPPRHADFLEEAAPLLSGAERRAFLALSDDAERDAWIEHFWQARDPDPATPGNAARDVWTHRVSEARQRFGTLADDRARALLLAGPPAGIAHFHCPQLLAPLERWSYPPADGAGADVTVLFTPAASPADGPHRLQPPGAGLAALAASPSPVAAARISRECRRGAEIAEAVAAAQGWPALEARSPLPLADGDAGPRVGAPASGRAGPPAGGAAPAAPPLLPARLGLAYPERRAGRTLLEASLAVASGSSRVDAAVDPPAYRFQLDGELRRDGAIADRFRYQLEVPAAALAAGADVPLAVERPLWPGRYRLTLRLEDLTGGGVFRHEEAVEVPSLGEAGPEAAAAPAAAGEPPAAAPDAIATAAGGPSLRLLPPPRELLTGRLRLEAIVGGEGVARVAFRLDGKPALAKTRPPYSVELDLGRLPRSHTVEAIAVGPAGEELARDEILLNAGAQAFQVRLVEPPSGARRAGLVRAVADVAVPPGERLDRLEFFVDEERRATLYQPPYAHRLALPPGAGLTWVRAVAYLADGGVAEDVAFLNAPDMVDSIRVDLVELYVSVTDARGRPIDDLAAADFAVFEEGAPQQVRRFERVRDLPVHAAVLIDTSESMAEELAAAEQAALAFFSEVLTPRDRAAVFTFADRLRLAVPFTNRLDRLAGGLADLAAGGQTVLHDAVVQALYAFGGLQGKRALILLSDGADAGSAFSFAEALDYARRAGVAVYAIGIVADARAVTGRMTLMRLAEETGGRSFMIAGSRDLPRIYRLIQEEMRSQYLLAYQSSDPRDDGAFRRVEVRVARPGLAVKTVRGYYPRP